MSTRAQFLLLLLAFIAGLLILIVSLTSDKSSPWAFLVGVTLLVSPILAYCFSNFRIPEGWVLLFALIPIAFMNRIHWFRVGRPVGFTDVHSHILQTQILFGSDGFIKFEVADRLAFNFVGMYIQARFLELMVGLDIFGVASLLPLVFTLVTLLFVYVLLRHLFPTRVALLAITFLGWEHSTLLFGQEFRTHLPAALLIFAIIYVSVIRGRRKRKHAAFVLLSIPLLAALSTMAFALSFLALLIFLGMVAIPYLLKRSQPTVAPLQIGIFVIFIISYILYISSSSDPIFGTLVRLGEESLTREVSPASQHLGQEIYGPVVRIFMFGFWGGALLSLVPTVTWRRFREDARIPALLLSFAGLIPFGLILQDTVGFSIGRMYSLGFVALAVIVAFGLITVARRSRPPWKKAITVLTSAVLIVFIIVSVSKLPSYITGPISPIRAQEPIDSVPNWWVDPRDDSTASFLASTSEGLTVHTHVPLIPYPLLDACYHTLQCTSASARSDGVSMMEELSVGDLVLLRHAFRGEPYTYRELLPPDSVYAGFHLLYSNGDYRIYLWGSGG